ncbi:MAG: TolC family protein [Bacteroidaceae bacterium]|nr:TolC family protein [Bacteroidaceae bacterium]
MRQILLSIGLLATMSAHATVGNDTTAMTAWDCVRYAVSHSHGLRQRELQADNAEATRLQTIGALLPNIGASVSAQMNFGRAIDPETNTYTNVSTVGTGYGLSGSMPVFDGMYRLHALRAARADLLMQKNALVAERDQLVLATYQACLEVTYAKEAKLLAAEKLHDSQRLLQQARVMEEEGLKSPTDVAQIQAQQAADALLLTQQENQEQVALLKLKEVMGWPGKEELRMTNDELRMTNDEWSARTVGGSAAQLLQSRYAVESARHNVGMARAAFYPTLSASGGINSSYYRNIDAPSHSSFSRQLKDNLGQWVGVSVSIPIFNRLGNLMALRRAKNNLRIAQEQDAAKADELEVLRQQATLDVEANAKEIVQAEAKTEADSIAYELIRRQFTEGLASPLEVQTAATTLLQSRTALLQKRLTRGLRLLQKRYYEGQSLVP